MSAEFNQQFQSLQIETCTSKLIVKKTIKEKGRCELTSCMFVGHVDLFMPNTQETIIQIAVGHFG